MRRSVNSKYRIDELNEPPSSAASWQTCVASIARRPGDDLFSYSEIQGTPKTILAGAATDSAGCHRDSVLPLASVKLNQRLLISSSRMVRLRFGSRGPKYSSYLLYICWVQ